MAGSATMKITSTKNTNTIKTKKSRQIILAFSVIVGLLAMNDSAWAERRPAKWGEYSKYPSSEYSTAKDGVAFVPETITSYRSLRNYLNQITDAEDVLRQDCIGTSATKMTAVVRGSRVLVWPERFKQCEENSQLVRNGDPRFLPLMNYLNRIYKADYPLPAGDVTLADAWEQEKSTILRFPSCDDASRSIVFAGSPGNPRSASEIFDANKNRCPSEWVALFQPETNDKATKKKNCPSSPGENLDSCINDPNISPLDSDLSALQQNEQLRDQQQATRTTEKPVPGAFKRNAKGSLENLGKNTRGSTPIYGGAAGEVLAALAQIPPNLVGGGQSDGRVDSRRQENSNEGCGSDAETSIVNDYNREMNSPAVKNASLDQNQCVIARIQLRLYQRLLPYAQRCKADAVRSIQSAIADMHRQEQQGCK